MPGTIVINPAVLQDKRDALAVAWDEALRLFMEDTGFEPEFGITPEQEKFFKNTDYADDEGALRKTIVARIATFDTSIKNPTPEQIDETARVLDSASEAFDGQPDGEVLKKLRAALAGARPEGAVPRAPAGDGSAEEASSAMGGGNVATMRAETRGEEAMREYKEKRAADAKKDAKDIVVAAANTLTGYLPRRVTDTAGALGESLLRAAADLAPGPVTRKALTEAGRRGREGTRKLGDKAAEMADAEFPRNRFSESAEMVADTAVGALLPWDADLPSSVAQAGGVASQRGEDTVSAELSQATGAIVGRGRSGGIIQTTLPAVSAAVIRPIPKVGKHVDAGIRAVAAGFGEAVETLVSEPLEKRVQEVLREDGSNRNSSLETDPAAE